MSRTQESLLQIGCPSATWDGFRHLGIMYISLEMSDPIPHSVLIDEKQGSGRRLRGPEGNNSGL